MAADLSSFILFNCQCSYNNKMASESLPKFMFLHEDSQEMSDKRIRTYQIYEEKQGKPTRQYIKRVNTTIPTIHKPNTQGIFNLEYSHKYGFLLQSTENQVLVIDRLQLERDLLAGKQNPEKRKAIPFAGQVFLSPSEEILAICSQSLLQLVFTQHLPAFNHPPIAKKHQHHRLLWVNDTSILLWGFLDSATLITIDPKTLEKVSQADMQGADQCTGASIVGINLLICKKLEILVYQLGKSQLVRKVDLKFQGHRWMYYEFSFIVEVFRVNVHKSPFQLNTRLKEPLNKDDILGLVMIFYDDQEFQNSQRCLTFFRGNLLEGGKDIRGNENFYVAQDRNQLYFQDDKIIPFGVKVAYVGCFICIMVERSSTVYVVDPFEKFEVINIYSPEGKLDFKAESKFFRGMAPFKHMLPFQQTVPKDIKSELLTKIVDEFRGEFMSLYFATQETNLTIPFPASVIALTQNTLYKRYAISSLGAIDKDHDQQIFAEMRKIKRSPYLLPTEKRLQPQKQKDQIRGAAEKPMKQEEKQVQTKQEVKQALIKQEEKKTQTKQEIANVQVKQEEKKKTQAKQEETKKQVKQQEKKVQIKQEEAKRQPSLPLNIPKPQATSKQSSFNIFNNQKTLGIFAPNSTTTQATGLFKIKTQTIKQANPNESVQPKSQSIKIQNQPFKNVLQSKGLLPSSNSSDPSANINALFQDKRMFNLFEGKASPSLGRTTVVSKQETKKSGVTQTTAASQAAQAREVSIPATNRQQDAIDLFQMPAKKKQGRSPTIPDSHHDDNDDEDDQINIKAVGFKKKGEANMEKKKPLQNKQAQTTAPVSEIAIMMGLQLKIQQFQDKLKHFNTTHKVLPLLTLQNLKQYTEKQIDSIKNPENLSLRDSIPKLLQKAQSSRENYQLFQKYLESITEGTLSQSEIRAQLASLESTIVKGLYYKTYLNPKTSKNAAYQISAQRQKQKLDFLYEESDSRLVTLTQEFKELNMQLINEQDMLQNKRIEKSKLKDRGSKRPKAFDFNEFNYLNEQKWKQAEKNKTQLQRNSNQLAIKTSTSGSTLLKDVNEKSKESGPLIVKIGQIKDKARFILPQLDVILNTQTTNEKPQPPKIEDRNIPNQSPQTKSSSASTSFNKVSQPFGLNSLSKPKEKVEVPMVNTKELQLQKIEAISEGVERSQSEDNIPLPPANRQFSKVEPPSKKQKQAATPAVASGGIIMPNNVQPSAKTQGQEIQATKKAEGSSSLFGAINPAGKGGFFGMTNTTNTSKSGEQGKLVQKKNTQKAEEKPEIKPKTNLNSTTAKPEVSSKTEASKEKKKEETKTQQPKNTTDQNIKQTETNNLLKAGSVFANIQPSANSLFGGKLAQPAQTKVEKPDDKKQPQGQKITPTGIIANQQKLPESATEKKTETTQPLKPAFPVLLTTNKKEQTSKHTAPLLSDAEAQKSALNLTKPTETPTPKTQKPFTQNKTITTTANPLTPPTPFPPQQPQQTQQIQQIQQTPTATTNDQASAKPHLFSNHQQKPIFGGPNKFMVQNQQGQGQVQKAAFDPTAMSFGAGSQSTLKSFTSVGQQSNNFLNHQNNQLQQQQQQQQHNQQTPMTGANFGQNSNMFNNQNTGQNMFNNNQNTNIFNSNNQNTNIFNSNQNTNMFNNSNQENTNIFKNSNNPPNNNFFNNNQTNNSIFNSNSNTPNSTTQYPFPPNQNQNPNNQQNAFLEQNMGGGMFPQANNQMFGQNSNTGGNFLQGFTGKSTSSPPAGINPNLLAPRK